MSASSIPTLIKAGLIRGIPPNNDLPLHSNLLGLTQEEMLHAVFSNLFVVPDVRINTLTWKMWDIFNDMDYTWKVVRSRPRCVKLLLKDGRCFLCEPCGNGLYRALMLTDTLRPTSLKSKITLQEALTICEDKAARIENQKRKKVKPFYDKRTAPKPCPSIPIIPVPNDPNSPYQAYNPCFKGREALILAIEELSKKMIARKACWVRSCNSFDFEKYLYAQIALDTDTTQSLDINRRKEILVSLREYGCSEKYFDIFSALELREVLQYKAAIMFC